MPKVFITNDAGHGYEYEKANKFGTLVTLTKFDEVDCFNFGAALQVLTEGLNKMTRDDWLLVSGRQTFALLAMLIQWRKFGTVRLLLFHAKKKEYSPRELSLKQLDDLMSSERRWSEMQDAKAT